MFNIGAMTTLPLCHCTAPDLEHPADHHGLVRTTGHYANIKTHVLRSTIEMHCVDVIIKQSLHAENKIHICSLRKSVRWQATRIRKLFKTQIEVK